MKKIIIKKEEKKKEKTKRGTSQEVNMAKGAPQAKYIKGKVAESKSPHYMHVGQRREGQQASKHKAHKVPESHRSLVAPLKLGLAECQS